LNDRQKRSANFCARAVSHCNEILWKPRVEVLVKDGVNFPDTDDKQNDDETNNRMDAWIHGSHLTDNKLLNDTLNNTTVDNGQQKDWSISDYKEVRLTTIDGKEYLNQTAKLYYDSKNSADTDITLNIPKRKVERIIRLNHWHQSKRMWSWL